MALAAVKLARDPMPDGFMPLADAASRMGMNPCALARKCKYEWEQPGLAIKPDNAWFIAKAADPRLADFETREGRDLRQIGELLNEGYKRSTIDRALRVVELIKLYDRFDCHIRNECERRRAFLVKCAGDGTFAALRVRDYTAETFRKICAAYHKGGVRAVVRKPYADRGSRCFGTKAIAYFVQVMRVGHGITVCDALKDLHGHVVKNNWGSDDEWRVPGVRAAQEWWKRNIPEPAKVLIAEGPRKFRAKCIPKIQRDAREDFAAGELLVLDERTFDFMCRAMGERGWYSFRLKLTVFRDEVSGMLVGWHIGRLANTDTILAALKQAIINMGTVPLRVIFDNGSGEKVVGGRRRGRFDSFDRKRVETATSLLGIIVSFARKHCPWAKSIESTFAALKVFDRFQVGFTGGSPTEKPEDMVQWTKGNILELPTLDDVREQFAAFLEAYHAEPRRSETAEGLAPEQAFRSFFTTRPRRVSRDTLDALCRRLVGPVTVKRDGVKYDRLQYGTRDEAVFKLQGRQVWIAVDPIERDSVILCEQDGTPICVANAAHPMGYHSEEVREAIAFQRRCERSVKEYAPSRDYLLKTTPQQIAERRKLAAKARQIPNKHLPPRPAAMAVQLVRPDIDAAAQKVKRAAGAETLRRLHKTDAAVKAVNETRPITLAELNARSAPLPVDEKPTRQVSLYELSKISEANAHAP